MKPEELLTQRLAELTVKSNSGDELTPEELQELGKSLLDAEGGLILKGMSYKRKADESEEDYSKRMMKMGYKASQMQGESEEDYKSRMEYMKAKGCTFKSDDVTREDLIKSYQDYLTQRKENILRGEQMKDDLEKAQKKVSEYEDMLKSYEQSEALNAISNSLNALFELAKSQQKQIDILEEELAKSLASTETVTKSSEGNVELFDKVHEVMKSLDERVTAIEDQPANPTKSALTKSQLMDKFGKFIDKRFEEGETLKSLATVNKKAIREAVLKSAKEGKIDRKWVTKLELAGGNPGILPKPVQEMIMSEVSHSA